MAKLTTTLKMSASTEAKLADDIAKLKADFDKKAQRLQQKALRLDRANSAAVAAQQKMETKKKIILGGALLALAKTDTQAAETLQNLLRYLEQNEKNSANRKALDFAPLDGAPSTPTTW